MTRLYHLAAVGLLAGAVVAGGPAVAADLANGGQQGGWFMPPPSSNRLAGSVMDTSVRDGVETVTVIGRRPGRSWRTHVGDATNNPLASNSAHPLTPPQPYCNSTLRTVGGQPSDTAEMMSGIGSGGC